MNIHYIAVNVRMYKRMCLDHKINPCEHLRFQVFCILYIYLYSLKLVGKYI